MVIIIKDLLVVRNNFEMMLFIHEATENQYVVQLQITYLVLHLTIDTSHDL